MNSNRFTRRLKLFSTSARKVVAQALEEGRKIRDSLAKEEAAIPIPIRVKPRRS
jgi:hypothetical protein